MFIQVLYCAEMPSEGSTCTHSWLTFATETHDFTVSKLTMNSQLSHGQNVLNSHSFPASLQQRLAKNLIHDAW